MANCLENIPEEIRDYVKSADDPMEALNKLKEDNARKRRNTEASRQKTIELLAIVDNHPDGPMAGIRSIISQDLHGKATNSNVWYRQQALKGIVEGMIPNLKYKLSTKNLGIDFGPIKARNEELADEFVRAVYGDKTVSKEALEMADEWIEASNFMRERFNEHGGNIGKLEGYLPQSHDRKAVKELGKEKWIDFIKDKLAIERMDIDITAYKARILDEIKKDFGYTARKKQFTKAEQSKIEAEYNKRVATSKEDAVYDYLSYAYDTIVTGGLNKISPISGGRGRGKSVINKNADHRVLHFKDATSWMEYQKAMGTPDPLAAIDNHIRGMTTDMGLVEILGPNPQAVYDTLRLKIDKMIAEGDIKGWRSHTDAIWNVVNGKVDQDLDYVGKVATVAQVMRGANVAVMLGKATLSAVTDLGSLMTNTVYHGMNPAKVMGRMIKNFKISNQEEAIRAGLGADVFSSEITQRFSELGQGFWAKAGEAVMRATFMNIWTEAGRKAFQAEYMHKLLKGRKLEDLTIDEKIKIIERVNEQSDYAVLMPTARTRAITTGGFQKGTATGELVRTGTQFQSFVISFMQQHGARIMFQGTVQRRIGYAASILTISTLLGAVAMTAKDAVKGWGVREGWNPFDKNTEAEDSRKFWTAAMLQGGGAGFIGDLLFSDNTRFGNSPIPSALGPTSTAIEDVFKLTKGNINEFMEGKDTHFGSEIVDFVNRHANPLNVFYTQTALEYLVYDRLKAFLDEGYEKRKYQYEKKRMKEYGQEKFEFLQD